MRLCLIFALAVPMAAQVCSTPVFPGSVATNAQLLIAADNIQTTLSSVQLFSDTTATLTSATGWMPNMIATIGLEQELVTAVVGNVITVTRGYAGTTQIQHPAQSQVSNLIDACYNNAKTAEIKAIETALGPNLSNVVGATAYVTAAISPLGQVVTIGQHGQGLNATGKCFAGTIVVVGGVNVASGAEVWCRVVPDGHGNLTFAWTSGDVQTLQVNASGRGPLGLQGPSGLGANPYPVNATSSPQSIPVGTHRQGVNVTVGCWSGPLVVIGGVSGISGVPAVCVPTLDGSGNISVAWTGSAVGSILVSASGTPAPYTANIVTTTTASIPQITHQKGSSPAVSCWTGSLSGNAVTGTEAYCEKDVDSSGNITLIYAGTSVGSVRVQ